MSLDPKTGERLRSVPYQYVQAIEERHPGIGDIGLRSTTMMTVHRGGDQAEWMETIAVTPEYLRVLGVKPIRGRFFDASDSGQAGNFAVITYQTWQRRFGSDETIIGRSVPLGPTTYVVIGSCRAISCCRRRHSIFNTVRQGDPSFSRKACCPVL
jgi:hypothetical protein